MNPTKENIALEINGEIMPPDTYEIIHFLHEDTIKIKAVFHDAPGYCKEHIQKNPEQFDPEDHSALLNSEEKINLSQSMRP